MDQTCGRITFSPECEDKNAPYDSEEDEVATHGYHHTYKLLKLSNVSRLKTTSARRALLAFQDCALIPIIACQWYAI